MNRGFAAVGLFRPKTPENVGGVLRAASAYGCAQVNVQGGRGKWFSHATNTSKAHRHTPAFIVDDLLSYVPHDTQIVCVDLIDGATPLPQFVHPVRALYIFGPEDGTLGKQHTDRAQHVVYVPTRHCMNLAATVNVVLYDRAAKEWKGSSEVERHAENVGVGGSIPPPSTNAYDGRFARGSRS